MLVLYAAHVHSNIIIYNIYTVCKHTCTVCADCGLVLSTTVCHAQHIGHVVHYTVVLCNLTIASKTIGHIYVVTTL